MFVVANQTAPKFYRHDKFLGGVRSLKTGADLKRDILEDRKALNSIYKNTPVNPYLNANTSASRTTGGRKDDDQ